MRFDIITIFPDMMAGFLSGGVAKKALERGLLEVFVHDLRDYTHDRHKQVDDRPFGGGEGMVLKPEPIFEAVEAVRKTKRSRVFLLSPQGARLDSALARKLSRVRRDSFFDCLLDYPHYSRPRDFRGMKVPQVLFSGNHARISDWRRREALAKTREVRPDLLLAKKKLAPGGRKLSESAREHG